MIRLDAKQFYDLIQKYKLALFSSSPTDDCVYYIYVEPSDVHLKFSGSDLCYIMEAEAVEGQAVSGVLIKGTVFDCKIYDKDSEVSVIFKSDMMEERSYLVLKK